jgi:hypothetical protein
MNLGELQAAIEKAFTEGASKTDTVYLNVDYLDIAYIQKWLSSEAREVDQHILDRKHRVVVIKGY